MRVASVALFWPLTISSPKQMSVICGEALFCSFTMVVYHLNLLLVQSPHRGMTHPTSICERTRMAENDGTM